MFFWKNEPSRWSHLLRNMGTITLWSALALASYTVASAVEPAPNTPRDRIIGLVDTHLPSIKRQMNRRALKTFLNSLHISDLHPSDTSEITRCIGWWKDTFPYTEAMLVSKTAIWQWLRHCKGVAESDSKHRINRVQKAIKDNHFTLLDFILTEMVNNIQERGYCYKGDDKVAIFHHIVVGLVKKSRLPENFDILFSKAAEIVSEGVPTYQISDVFREAMRSAPNRHLETIVRNFQRYRTTSLCLHSQTKRRVLEHATQKSYANFHQIVKVLAPSRTILLKIRQGVPVLEPDSTTDTFQGGRRFTPPSPQILQIIDRMLKRM